MTSQIIPTQFQMSVEEFTPTTARSESKEAALVSDLRSLPSHRKVSILIILCTALFLDTFNSSSLFTAVPFLAEQVKIPDNETVWLFGGYQLTFAGLLLICGRISDLYNPKYVFLTGSTAMAIFTLIAGFLRTEIPLILFRALMGVGGALTIPSSQHLIVHMYPDPESQAKALAVFGGMAGLGLVLGLLIGALFVQFVSWPWVFHFGAIVSAAVSIGILLLVPNLRRSRSTETRLEKILRFKRLDLFGASVITAGLILFIFAVTSGSSAGWGSAQVIASLVLSVILTIGFFIYEAYIPEDIAALPPKIWKYENVAILLVTSFVPVMWWGAIQPLFSFFWQTAYNWSPMKIAVHLLPISLGLLPLAPLMPVAVKKVSPKWLLIIGFIINLIGNLLLPFDNSPDRYWRFGFPGFLLGTAGAAIIYSTINIVLLSNTPPEISGVVSGLFLAVGQTGAAGGLSIVTSIQTSVQKQHGGPLGFDGREAGLWFLFAIISVFGILFLIFMKDTGPVVTDTKITPFEESYEQQPLSEGDVVRTNFDKD